MIKFIEKLFGYLLWIFGWPQFISMRQWSKRDDFLSRQFILECSKLKPDLEYMRIMHERLNENYKAWKHMSLGGIAKNE